MNEEKILEPKGVTNGLQNEHKKIVELIDVAKSFDGEVVLDHINLVVKEKEFMTLLGPSGCGKSTTLNIIAGFVTPDTGDVLFENVKINDVPANKRHVNTVFQKYALFPHLNVYENIAFALRLKKLSEEEIYERVEEMLAMVNLRGFEKRDVNLLSGGQQQRVAIARALINKPKVLLLDEPLAALDLKLRKDMQNELKNMQRKTGITFIYVTHDQEEALSMSDTVVVMANGKIQQIGTPTDIYNEPENAFVADFIGESNIIDGVMLDDYKAKFSGHEFECLDKGFNKNEPVDVVIRPEDVDVVPVEKGMLVGMVTSVTFKGVHYEIIVDIDNFKWMIQSTDYVAPNEKIGIYIEPDAIHIMKKSEFSNMFGDYSSFSDELERLSDTNEEENEEDE
ncbi:MAG: ABC transporter ATP-binding protein [Clostridia bacterium]|nr:ABC transporter ATP-binding protein [Clostridia bacterium]